MGDKNTSELPVISQELKNAVVEYFSRVAYMEKMRPTVEAYQAQVVADSNLQYSPFYAPEYTGTITSMADSWMMEDSQSIAFYAALDAARDAAGFTGFEPGYCPLLVAEHAVIQAKWAICDESRYFTGVGAKEATRHHATFIKFVDTTISLVVSMHPEIVF